MANIGLLELVFGAKLFVFAEIRKNNGRSTVPISTTSSDITNDIPVIGPKDINYLHCSALWIKPNCLTAL